MAVHLLELVRLFLKYKWGTIFRSEWFWRMEELTKRNGECVWMREIEKVLKIFDSTIELLTERIWMREEEIERIRGDRKVEEF